MITSLLIFLITSRQKSNFFLTKGYHLHSQNPKIFLPPQIQFLRKSTYPLFVTYLGVTPTQPTFEILGLKVEKTLKKCDFYGIFYHLIKDISRYNWKLILRIFAVVQTTLGGNPTCSFTDI